MGNVLNPKQHCFAIGTVVGSIINPKQYCFAISAALGSIPNPKQYCFAISAAMGSILNPKQYCHQQHHYPQGADKLDAWGIPLEMPMSNFDSKDFWTWQENVPTVEPLCREYGWSSSLIKGKWKSYWGLQLGFCSAFCLVWIVVTVSVTRQGPN